MSEGILHETRPRWGTRWSTIGRQLQEPAPSRWTDFSSPSHLRREQSLGILDWLQSTRALADLPTKQLLSRIKKLSEAQSNYFSKDISRDVYRAIVHSWSSVILVHEIAFPRSMEEIEPQVLDDSSEEPDEQLAIFRAMLPSLISKYEGQYVALHNLEIVDYDQNEAILAERVCAKYAEGSILIEKVSREARPVLHMPSPVFVR